MIFSGLTLKFTKIASFVGIIQYLLLFASGTLISLDKLPAALLVLTKVLPINLGLKVSQNPFELTTFLLLILQMIIYMVIGTLTFTYVYNRAKKRTESIQDIDNETSYPTSWSIPMYKKNVFISWNKSTSIICWHFVSDEYSLENFYQS